MKAEDPVQLPVLTNVRCPLATRHTLNAHTWKQNKINNNLLKTKREAYFELIMVLHACSSGSQVQGWCRQYKEGRGGRDALLCVVG